MAYWKLVITGKDELTDADLSHICDVVYDGFTEGELNDEEAE